MRESKDPEVRSSVWRPVAFVVFIIVALAVPVASPVVDIVTGRPVPGVTLAHPVTYLLLAPLCGVLDALTALSLRQHIAFLGFALSLFVIWRLFRLWRPTRRRGLLLTALRELGVLALFLGTLVGVYAVGVLLPRPMARLHVGDPDVVVVDFHSHTLLSHDGRKSFTAERNRAWHRAGGFDVAYVTDHDSTRAALDAEKRNPRRAGDGTVLLAGREVVYRDMHVTTIGTFDPRTRTSPSEPCGPWPVVVGTIPANLSRVPRAECPDHGGGLSAIELLDGAPKGLDVGDRQRDLILAIADSLDLAIVASSDNHGWGSTAVGWSLMRIPAWRDMAPEQLNDAIVRTIRTEGRHAVEVVGLRRPREVRTGLWATVEPLLLPQTFVSRLGRAERIAWLTWIALALWLSALWSKKRRTTAP
ncbi:MAG: hypothetical protein LJF04_15865 [Gemmatimonadetes bacterium]|nr:hypothetical protein [Gemmatimonadota bacterium]